VVFWLCCGVKLVPTPQKSMEEEGGMELIDVDAKSRPSIVGHLTHNGEIIDLQPGSCLMLAETAWRFQITFDWLSEFSRLLSLSSNFGDQAKVIGRIVKNMVL
jgi:hypothetical protein